MDKILKEVLAKVKPRGVPADIKENDGDYKINFQEPQAAVTPGQSIVFYRDDVVLGGGIIERPIND